MDTAACKAQAVNVYSAQLAVYSFLRERLLKQVKETIPDCNDPGSLPSVKFLLSVMGSEREAANSLLSLTDIEI